MANNMRTEVIIEAVFRHLMEFILVDDDYEPPVEFYIPEVEETDSDEEEEALVGEPVGEPLEERMEAPEPHVLEIIEIYDSDSNSN